MATVDVLLVSLGSTHGLRTSDAVLAAALQRAGARVTHVSARAPREVRTMALTDLAWALAARRATRGALARGHRGPIIYSTITAALLAPAPGAIRFDALAAENRPGRHGLWQRSRERRVLAVAPLLIPVSSGSLAGYDTLTAPVVTVPIAVDRSGPLRTGTGRDIAAISYVADPHKKGLDRILAAWSVARRDGEELLLAGIEQTPPGAGAGVRAVGRLESGAYRALLRRARIYLAAPRREDHGLAQLEALADGCLLVSTDAQGAYAAAEVGRSLDPRLIGVDLPGAIRIALDEPRAGYADAAQAALAGITQESVDRVVADELLGRLSALYEAAATAPPTAACSTPPQL